MRVKILVADNDRLSRQALRKIFQDDYDIAEAATGREALALLRDPANTIAAALLDAALPDTDGFEALARLRGDADTARIPVIISTDSAESAWEAKAFSLGANDFIRKPYSAEVLKCRLANVLATVNSLARLQAETESLRISEAQFRIAAAASGRVIARYDIKSSTYYGSERSLLTEGRGQPVENAPQVFIDRGNIAPECVAAYLAFFDEIKRGESPCSADIAFLLNDKQPRWFRCDATVMLDDDGQPSQAVIVYTDITEQRQKETVYKRWKQSLRQKTPESYTLVRGNLSKNAAFDSVEGALLEISSIDPGVSFNDSALAYASLFVHPEDREAYLAVLDADTLLANYYRDKRAQTLEYRELLPDGTPRWLRLTIEMVEYPNSSDVEAYLLYEDIDAQKKAELQTKENAETDPLTGVLNRMAFVRETNLLLEKNNASQHALLMLDIDGFKQLNDVFGHAAGDEALIEIANSLRTVLRHGDLLGRLGGDEFVICLKDVPYDAVIEKKARQLCSLIRKAYRSDVHISASIGIAVYPKDGETFDALYRNADAALYRVKDSGKDNFAYFDHDLENSKLSSEKEEGVAPAKIQSAVTKRRMLIVDDSEINRKMLTKLFEQEFNIETAPDGNAALVRLRHYGASISVVLLDLVMPGMDGFDVMKAMQESLEMRSIPVIVVSGEDERETSLRAIKSGAADYVTKPVDPALIRLRVQSAISKAESERLRAQNSYLLLQSSEEAKYRIVLDSTGTVVIEHDWVGGVFTYDSSISKHIAGDYNDRKLWHIFMADMVADALDVKAMQELVYTVANDKQKMDGDMMVMLKTPSGEKQWFRMRAFKCVDEFQLTDKVIITYVNVNEEVLADEKLRFQAERDALTGLYSRAAFFEKAAGMIAAHEPGYYIMACFDINNFKVVNDQYGSEKGDSVLQQVADIFRTGFEAVDGLACRITADNFAVLYPTNALTPEELLDIRERAAVFDGSIPPVSFSIGRYIVDDLSLSVSAMYDRAVLAEMSVKGRFDANIAFYDESMRDALLYEQTIVNEMKPALAENHFEVWLQPQYNHTSGALIGAEALVRWRHPVRGLIAPGEFIPVFERNGFIYELDKYVWEQSCITLRRWMDEGRSPLPVSVNVSRYDLFREDLLDTITGLIGQYQIPIELLRLEITESAFAESVDRIIRVVKELIGYGFTVEIDDFGSGYSSLNTLKDVPAQIVKLDMRFLENNDHTDRGGNILESVVRMAKWLGMSVIAEGVETTAQADYLKSIGCNYVQGYLYAKPMPVEEYEKLAQVVGREEKLSTLETVENLNNNAFWDPGSMDTLIFNSYVGGACIFEYHSGNIELLRATDKYAQVIGSAGMTVDDALRLDWAEHLDEKGRQDVSDAIRRSIEERDDVTCEYVFFDLPGCPEKTYLRSTIRVIASAGERYLIYCTNENITAQREAEQKEHATAERMRAVMENVNNGVTAVVTRGEDVEYIFVNDRYYAMLGYTRAQYEAEVTNTFDLIHPEDRQWVLEAVENINATGEPAVLEYRVLRRDGEIIWERNSVSVTRFDGIDAPVQLGIATDITDEKLAALRIQSLNQNLQNMMNDTPGGFVRMRVLPDGSLTLAMEYANETFCRLRGMTQDELMAADGEDAMHAIHPDDLAYVRSVIEDMIQTGKTCNIQFRLKHESGGYIPVNVFGRITESEAGETYINVYFADLSEQEKKDLTLRETMPYILSAIMEYSTDLMFAKDKDFRYICCSPAFVKFTRQKSESDVIGKTDYDFWTKEEADHFRGDDMRLFELGEPLLDYIEPIPSDDGIQHYCSTSKYILRDSTGEVIGMYGIGRDVTATRTALEQLTLLANNIPGGLATYEVSPGGIRITYFNDGFCEMMGYSREEYAKICETGVTNITFEEDVPLVMAQIEALVRDDTPINCTYRVYSRDGSLKWVNSRGNAGERRGDVCSINIVLFDVTEAKLAEEAARIHEKEMRLAMSQLGKMICEYDPATRTLTVPESFAAQFDLPTGIVRDVPESLLRANIIHEDSIPAYRAFYDAILHGEEAGSMEYRDQRADGSTHWERAEFSTIFNSDGKPAKTVIAVEDTTEQHLRYELERSRPMMGEENLLVHALFNLNTGETLDYAYPDGQPVPPEARTAFLFGGDNLEEIIINREEREHYRELNDPQKLLQRYAEGETELSIDYRRKMPDGAIIWVRNLLHMIPEPGGSDVLLFEYCYNIETEKTQELMYRTLVNENYDYVARINGKSGRFSVIFNAAAKETLVPQSGEDFEAVAAAVVNTRVHPDDMEMALENLRMESIKENLRDAGRFRFTFRTMLPDGDVCYKRMTQYYLDRERDTIIMTREDVTELMLEEKRRSAQLEAALLEANEESRVKEREAAAQLSLILNNVNGGMSATTFENGKVRYLFVNDEFYALFGLTPAQYEEEQPLDMRELIYPEDLALFDEAVRDTATKGAARLDVRAYRSDGSLIWIRNISSSCTFGGIDTPVYIVVSIDVTKEKEAADSLRMSEEQFRIAASIGGRAIARYDIKTGAYHHNDAVLLGMGFAETIENMPQALIDADVFLPESIPAYREFYDRIRRGEETCRLDTAVYGKDRETRWIHADATVIFDAEGAPAQAIIVFYDITEQQEKEAVYKRWQQSLQQRPNESYTLFRCNLSQNASFHTMEGSLLHMRFSPEAATFNDRTREYVDKCVYLEDREAYLAFLASDTLLANYYRGVRSKTLEYREVQPDHSLRWLRLSVELMEYPNSSDVEAYLMFEDIDENKRVELRTKERAETDPLTGVLNRVAFSQAVEHMIEGPSAVGSFAMLMLDIDGFKRVNDTFGHAMGDDVLTDVARSLRGVLRHGDILGRLGGDEFMIAIPNMAHEADVENKASQICTLLHRVLSPEVYISASIGIALYPRDGKDFETLYRKMDTALYVIKNHGKNNFAFFSENMNSAYDKLGSPEFSADIAKMIVHKVKRRMLIVEDKPVSLAMLAGMFEDDFIIETAKDGNEALLCLRQYGTGISVVLLDLVMPGMDGFAVLEKMRASMDLRTIPVIVVSAMDELETSLKTIQSGAADYVTKPVNPDLLRLRVQSAISKAENDRLRAQNNVLLMHNAETAKYRAALQAAKATVMEYDPASGQFFYDKSVADHIAGLFDDRALWDILLAENALTADDMAKMQKLIADTADGTAQAGGSIYVTLKTPSQAQHLFRMDARKRSMEEAASERLILTWVDTDEDGNQA